MFKFKMLTKVLVAVFVLGQLIESNLNLCIALSIDLDAPGGSVKLHKAWQSSSEAPGSVSTTNQEDGDQLGGGRPSASRAPASTRDHQDSSSAGPAGNASDGHGLGHGNNRTRISQRLESNGRFNYFGTIYVGEKRQPFMVLFDLSSSALWLPSSECQSLLCISRQKYGRPAEWASLKRDGRELLWAYDGNMREARASGRLVRDRLTFAGATLENQTFGEALEMTGEPFAHLPVDGFFGLGLGALEHERPIERLHRMGLLREPIFSLQIRGEVGDWRYSVDNGELVLGELADGYKQAELTYVPVTRADSWEFRLSAVSLRQPYGDRELEQACESACPAILDSGGALISGHFTDVDRLNRAMGAYPDGAGSYRLAHCDLSRLPDLVFSIGGAEFSLAPDEYVTRMRVGGETLACYSDLRAVSADQYPYWILGERFLKRHYVVFDYGQRRIGFARSKSMPKEIEVDIYGRTRRKLHMV